MAASLPTFFEKIRCQQICVIGVGVSNTPLIRLLRQKGAQVTACDKKDRSALGARCEELEQMGVTLRLGEHYLDDLAADLIIKTPGMRFDHPALLAAQARGAVVTSEMELFFELCPCPIIGVTGSDGKTTTTTLIAEMLRAAGKEVLLGGNIGTPLLPLIESITPDQIAVVELSSFQLHTMRRSPNIAVITNITPNHLDVHKDMNEYIDAKANILRYQTARDRCVLNLECSITRSLAALTPARVCYFSHLQKPAQGVYLQDGVIYAKLPSLCGPVLQTADIRIRGAHNIQNYMAAIAAVAGLVPVSAMQSVARTFAGVPHRIEFVRTVGGADYFNDSIASSPTRAIAALHAFDRKVILIAGGYDKHIPFDDFGNEICDHVKTLVLCGTTAPLIEAAVKQSPRYEKGHPVLLHADNLAQAVALCRDQARQGDIVTLSPGCASFDAFENFEQRGDAFRRLVLALPD